MTSKKIFEEFKKSFKRKDKKSRQITIILMRVLGNMKDKFGKDIYKKLYGECETIDEVIKCYIKLRKKYYDFRKMLDVNWYW